MYFSIQIEVNEECKANKGVPPRWSALFLRFYLEKYIQIHTNKERMRNK